MLGLVKAAPDLVSVLHFIWYTPLIKASGSSTIEPHFDGLVQDCSNSIVLAMELLQSCTKPMICALNRHQTILHTFSQLFPNLTLSGVPHLYRQLPNGQYLSDLCKMCNLEANLWKMWTGDHRILTCIFKWERLNTAGHSHTVSIGHWVASLYND